MNDEENREVTEQEEHPTPVNRVRRIRSAVLMLVVAMCLNAPALATSGGESATGLSAVMSSMDNVVTLCTKVWNLLTGNEYLTLFLALGLVFAGLRVFRRAKKTASR